MINKYVKRKISECWNYQCAICGRNDYLEFHHLIPVSEGGTDDYDNIILLCACCHAAVHGRTYNPQKPNCRTSVDYETAKPILAAYFANKIGRDTRTVRRWMYEGIPNLGDLELIVMALEVSVWDMLSDGEDVPFIFRDFIMERS